MSEYLRIYTNAEAISEALEKVSERRLAAWVQYALSSEADDFAEYVKEGWLTGRAMKKVTGETYESVRPWTPKKRKLSGTGLFASVKGVYVRPGVNIPGTLNYLGRYIGTKHEFMKSAWAYFNASQRVVKAVDENVARMLDKVNYYEK